MSRLITEPNSSIRSVISLRDAPASAPCLKKREGGKGVEMEKRQRTNSFFSPFFPSFFSEKMLVSAPLNSKEQRGGLRRNGCINELLCFLKETFYSRIFLPSRSLPLTQETPFIPFPHSGFLLSLLLTCFYLYTSLEPWRRCFRPLFFFFFFFFFNFYFQQPRSKGSS